MNPSTLAGPALRVSAGLLLCAACFQAGLWYGELKTAAAPVHAKGAPGGEFVDASFRGAPMPAQESLLSDIPPKEEHIPGGPGGDIITPLNVRDPSALIMGPSHLSCPPAPAAEPATPAKKAKPRKLKEGRLLELLNKADEKSASPKSY